MASDEEEYYDSIDDTEFDKCRSFCNNKFRDEEESELGDSECNKLNELMVPFYNGNVGKSEINCLKNDSKCNSVTTIKNNKLKRRAPLVSLTDHRKNRSYLTMFYARVGQPVKSDDMDTTRATCSELSPKSHLSNENEEKESCFGNATVSVRLYSRFMEKEISQASSGINNEGAGPMSPHKCESETTIGSKLFSVSEAPFNSCVTSRDRSKRDMGKCGKVKSKPVKLGQLGGLGPNIAQEKLELLRKRQDYGKTASEKNRLKFLENKVVRKLRQEIAECNKY